MLFLDVLILCLNRVFLFKNAAWLFLACWLCVCWVVSNTTSNQTVHYLQQIGFSLLWKMNFNSPTVKFLFACEGTSDLVGGVCSLQGPKFLCKISFKILCAAVPGMHGKVGGVSQYLLAFFIFFQNWKLYSALTVIEASNYGILTWDFL